MSDDDHVAYTIEPRADWLSAERLVDELNGDAGMTVAWVVEDYGEPIEADRGELYVAWVEDGDIQRRDDIIVGRLTDDVEVKYP